MENLKTRFLDKKRYFHKGFLSAICLFTIIIPKLSFAQTLGELLPGILSTDPRIIQAQLSNNISQNSLYSSYGEWLPAVDLSGHYGYEEIHNQDSDNTYYEARKFQAKLTQLLFVYSKLIGVDEAQVNKEVSDLSLESTRQSITLEATKSYFNVVKAYEVLGYAKASEKNIMKQVNMEEARQKKGFGVSTDVLQAQSQLDGARATRVRAEGAYATAINNFRKVFRKEPEAVNRSGLPTVPYDKIPATVEEILETTKTSNLTLKQSQLAIDLAELAKESSKSSFMPEVKFIGQSQFKEDDGGTANEKREHLAKIDFTFSLFNGGKDYYALKNSVNSMLLAKQSHKESLRVVTEQTENFWKNYLTARERVQHLQKQVQNLGKFLELAKKERKLGKRSLLDVLNGETNFILSQSNYVAAQTDMALAVYDLIFVTGKLEEKVITSSKPVKQNPKKKNDDPKGAKKSDA